MNFTKVTRSLEDYPYLVWFCIFKNHPVFNRGELSCGTWQVW